MKVALNLTCETILFLKGICFREVLSMLRALLYKNAPQFTKSYLNVDIAEERRRHINFIIL